MNATKTKHAAVRFQSRARVSGCALASTAVHQHRRMDAGAAAGRNRAMTAERRERKSKIASHHAEAAFSTDSCDFFFSFSVVVG